jgi:glutaredoxin
MIKIYSLDPCPKCTLVRKYLEEKNILFEEQDARRLHIHGFMSVPIIEIDNILYPFSSLGELEKLLKRKGIIK